MKKILSLLILLMIASLSFAAEPPDFWSHWGDGKAELSGYRLTQPRYGELRRGTAVSIFVTEGFSSTLKVKAEKGQVPDAEWIQVIKHNYVEDFQTGIYDYNLMTSIFTAAETVAGRSAGAPVKASFSSQEWCGNLYAEIEFEGSSIEHKVDSYFFGETNKGHKLDYPDKGIVEDFLPTIVRGLVGKTPVAPGQSATLPFLPSMKHQRILHKPAKWTTALISRESDEVSVTVPAGTFLTQVWKIAPAQGPSHKFYVEADYPHRIIKWTGSDGYSAELTGFKRLPYWKLKSEGDEALLKELGLKVPKSDSAPH